MKWRMVLRGVLLAGAVLTGACKDILVGGHHFVHADGGGGGSDGSGAGGFAPASCSNGETACGDACVSLTSDPFNCGSCGHDCLGASCDSGFCAAESVASGLSDPRGIAADETHIYWTTGSGAVQRALKSGGPAETLIDGQEEPGAIAVDESSAYWVNEESGRLMKLAKDGSGNVKTLTTSPGLLGLALQGGDLVLSRRLKKGAIERIGKDGGGQKVLVKEQPQPTRIVVAGDRIFWTGVIEADDDDDHDGLPDGDEGRAGGYVRAASSNGEDVQTLAIGEGNLVDFAVGGSVAVWASDTEQQIRAFPIGANEPVTLAENQDVRGLAADSQSVFWTTGGGAVRRAPLAGGDSQLIVIEVAGAGAAVVDGPYVYFTRTGASGAILRVAK